MEVWVKPLSDNNWAVTFLNKSEIEKNINFNWKNNNIKDADFGYEANFTTTNYKLTDLWKNKEVGTTKKSFSGKLGAHDVITLRLTPLK